MVDIHKGSIIQANENAPAEWIGCLLMVDEVKSWGVQAFVTIPGKGNAFIRLTSDQYDLVGEAVLVPAE